MDESELLEAVHSVFLLQHFLEILDILHLFHHLSVQPCQHNLDRLVF